MKRYKVFSLVEILVVIFITAILSAILFPVFSRIQNDARRKTCISNIRQIGMAINMYCQDYDDIFPAGCDPIDKFTAAWNSYPSYKNRVDAMPLLNVVLYPYTKNHQLWMCPDDSGNMQSFDNVYVLNYQNKIFNKYGMSYLYMTLLTIKNKNSYLVGKYMDVEFYPAEIGLIFDGGIKWHDGVRNVLFADGHCEGVNRSRMNTLINMKFD